jgi:hypothetical protein
MQAKVVSVLGMRLQFSATQTQEGTRYSLPQTCLVTDALVLRTRKEHLFCERARNILRMLPFLPEAYQLEHSCLNIFKKYILTFASFVQVKD